MKSKIYFCALLLSVGITARADALNTRQIPPDAKWLIHLDCESLRQTQVGNYLLNQFVTPKVTEATSAVKLNVSNILQRITSITAYGADFKQLPQANGVLLIHSDAETQKALEGLLVAQILANTNGPVKKLESDDATLYSFANEVFIAPQKGGPIVISKSQAQIEAARELLAGKGPSLASSKAFSGFPGVSNSFFFLGVAEAFGEPNAIPAGAKVLQMADGGRVALGEREDQVFLDLALRGKTAEVARQIQQVIEGMVALVTLGQPDNADLMDLAKSAKVSSVGKVVTVSLEYPAGKMIARLQDEMTPKPKTAKAPHHKPHPKGMQKQKSKPEAEEETDPSK